MSWVLKLKVTFSTDCVLAAFGCVDFIVVEETDWALLFRAGNTVVFAGEANSEFFLVLMSLRMVRSSYDLLGLVLFCVL